jgi:hypothetical protein
LEGVEVDATITPSIAAIFPEIAKRGVKAVNFKVGEAS